MRNRDYSKPQVMDEGFGVCIGCETYTYQQRLQDVEDIEYKNKRVLYPVVYNLCFECGEKFQWYTVGQYDDLLGLYMIRAKLENDNERKSLLVFP